MKWIYVKDKLPPPNIRVLTYSPSYHGARESAEQGVVILSHNPDPNGPDWLAWVDDHGEGALFAPMLWRSIPKVEF